MLPTRSSSSSRGERASSRELFSCIGMLSCIKFPSARTLTRAKTPTETGLGNDAFGDAHEHRFEVFGLLGKAEHGDIRARDLGIQFGDAVVIAGEVNPHAIASAFRLQLGDGDDIRRAADD